MDNEKVQKRLLESNERIALYRNQPKFIENDKVSMVARMQNNL